MQKEKIKVAVGLSGGVDSAVSAALLKDQGYDVIGVHMLRWDDDIPGCTGSIDRQDALQVAKYLNIPFRVVDFQSDYKKLVVDRFLSEVQKGYSPNPDVWCNEFLKFGVFMDYALHKLGVEYIATGHYARIKQIGNRNSSIRKSSTLYQKDSKEGYLLKRGVDETKDQSYFLYRLSQFQLLHILFPLGELTKNEVRARAESYGLNVAHKKDSVGICFIGDINVAEFITEHTVVSKGLVADMSGKEIGFHQGVQLYTIGQRSGFTLTQYQGDPLYVVKKDVQHNTLVVGRGVDSDVLGFTVSELFIHEGMDKLPESVLVRIRHLGELLVARIHVGAGGELKVEFTEPVRAVSPGQHAVFYDEHAQVLGGGGIALTY